MSTNMQHQILDAITDAISAANREPELLTTIKNLREELEYAKLEIEDARNKASQQELTIHDYANTIQSLRGCLDAANDELDRLANELHELHAQNRTLTNARNEIQDSLYNECLVTKLLQYDITALNIKLSDSETLYHRAKTTLSRIFGEAASVIEPASEVALPSTFPDNASALVEIGKSIDTLTNKIANLEPIPLVETNRVVDEVKVESTQPLVHREPDNGPDGLNWF
jgi:chromosome segregation ATPase